MDIKDRKDCREIIAIDNTRLRELFNPRLEPQRSVRCSLAEARVEPGQATLPHILKSAEVYYLLRGSGEMRVDEERRPVTAGQAVLIPPGSVQSIKNTGPRDLVFLCIVDPAWRAEDEELASEAREAMRGESPQDPAQKPGESESL
jgi:mannose-6-phosphate isomerase-like protein (cupin superfamily)